MSSQTARLLGFAPIAGIDALRSALNAVPGPAVHACHGPTIAALLQPEPEEGLLCRDRGDLAAGLMTVQRRMEVACQAGPFLPMDPSAAVCPAQEVPEMLTPSWHALTQALDLHGDTHQWDIVLSWSPEPILQRHRNTLLQITGREALADAVRATLLTERGRREAALLNALAPAVRAFAAGGSAYSETGVSVTVLVAAGAEARVEAALERFGADDAGIDMRGPLPPLNFAAVRVAAVEAAAIVQAWHRLDLPERVNPSDLHRHWRRRSATVHPAPAAGGRALTLEDMGEAYRTLRPLMLLGDGAPQTLPGLLRHAGRRLIGPEIPARAEPLLELVS